MKITPYATDYYGIVLEICFRCFKGHTHKIMSLNLIFLQYFEKIKALMFHITLTRRRVMFDIISNDNNIHC